VNGPPPVKWSGTFFHIGLWDAADNEELISGTGWASGTKAASQSGSVVHDIHHRKEKLPKSYAYMVVVVAKHG
jgi:hypothetical protein